MTRQGRRRRFAGVLTVLACCLLGACGQKGPLTLPEPAVEPVQAEGTPAENAQPGDERPDDEN